jgi:ankyrin repeat protein
MRSPRGYAWRAEDEDPEVDLLEEEETCSECTDEDEYDTDGVEEEGEDNYGSGPERALWDACSDNFIDEVRELVTSGVDVNTIDEENGTAPVHISSELGHVGVLQVLVGEGGADVNLRDDEGSTALHAAAINAESDVARFLIQVGATRKRR